MTRAGKSFCDQGSTNPLCIDGNTEIRGRVLYQSYYSVVANKNVQSEVYNSKEKIPKT